MPRQGKITPWESKEKVVLSISREEDTRATATQFGEALLETVGGATMVETVGRWEGKTEYGVQITIIGDNAWPDATTIAEGAISGGCYAVQWEVYDESDYAAYEYRRLDKSDSV